MSTEETKPLRVIFMGTPDFALEGLNRLAQATDFKIVGVYTQADKPVGRAQTITPPPVKVMAKKYGFKIIQPAKIKTEIETIRDLKPDLIVVIAYGKIIPQAILDLPTYGCINVHASLLPKYRGASCLTAPILNGDSETGVTIMKMDAGLDTGGILRQAEMKLDGRANLETVHDALSALGADLLVPTLRDYVAGKIKPQAQDETQASYVKIIKKEDGRIDWTKPATEIERMIRAYNPWPGTYTEQSEKILKIIEATPEILNTNSHKPGDLFIAEHALAIQCGQGAIVILNYNQRVKKS